MNREDRIKLAIKKGITCDPETGKVYGIRGKEIKSLSNGYITVAITYENTDYRIFCHQFIYYWVHKTVVDCIDHINGIKNDNRIDNLRNITRQQNTFNTKAKGYSWNKPRGKWLAEITIDGKRKYLGRFEKEEQAKEAYLNAKKVYHIL